MRKTTIFTFTLLSLTILPAMAQVQTGLGQVWTDFQSYSTDLQQYLQDNLSENSNPLEVQSQNAALNSAKGELKIPNPVAAGQQVRNDLINYSYRSDSRASRFENNSVVRGNLVSNELNRLITRGIAVGVLGKNGQTRTKLKLDNIENTLKIVADSNDENPLNQEIQKFKENIPQPPLNNNDNRNAIAMASGVVAGLGPALAVLLEANQETLQIQKEQIKIVGESYAKSTQLEQTLQYSNLNLANISQQAEEANRAQRVDTSTEAARLLRATSQLDLFGRKVGK
ncbi:hypothetical protein [uncultured Nostoc sp.]|uniref:hypothetical protein n=1 Tax=uncultured Nostoc sp. TaxID=340711 RepID=UPI0035C973C2